MSHAVPDPSPHPRPVAIVTGGSSGIGLATARVFLARGDRVVLGGRDTERLSRAAESLIREIPGADVVTVAGELADPATGTRLVEAGRERFGQVDVLVNNAGMFAPKPFVEVTPEEVERFVAANLLGTYWVTQAFVRRLWPTGAGAPSSTSPRPCSRTPSAASPRPLHWSARAGCGR